ncbi:MAG: TIGR03618 family F420-dependent PPOX class oxidoreductase [Chloroflexota bacterium]
MSTPRRDGLVTHTRSGSAWDPALDPRLDDLLRRSRNAILATTSPSGAPQATPTWYRWDGEAISASVPGWTVKVANVRREPRVSFVVDDQVAGTYAALTGRAEIVEGPPSDREGVRAVTWPLLLKYLPDDEAAARWARIDADRDRVLIRLVPTRILWRSGVR